MNEKYKSPSVNIHKAEYVRRNSEGDFMDFLVQVLLGIGLIYFVFFSFYLFFAIKNKK